MLVQHPIPDSYWVIPGKLLAGEFPGAPTEAGARDKLASLFDAGVTCFLDLTEAGEYNLRPYWPTAQALAQARDHSVEHHRLPIRDLSTPSVESMRFILDQVDAALTNGACVYLHCFGGIGRTGTVVGCYLVRHGMTPEAALAEIATRRQGTPDGDKRSPETEPQRAFVRSWQSGQ